MWAFVSLRFRAGSFAGFHRIFLRVFAMLRTCGIAAGYPLCDGKALMEGMTIRDIFWTRCMENASCYFVSENRWNAAFATVSPARTAILNWTCSGHGMPSCVLFLSIMCSCYIRDSHGCRRHGEVIPVVWCISDTRNDATYDDDSPVVNGRVRRHLLSGAQRGVFDRNMAMMDALESGEPIGWLARRYRVSRQWVSALRRRYAAEGEAGLLPRSRRPARVHNCTDEATRRLIASSWWGRGS